MNKSKIVNLQNRMSLFIFTHKNIPDMLFYENFMFNSMY